MSRLISRLVRRTRIAWIGLLSAACAGSGPATSGSEDPLARYDAATSRAGTFTAAWRVAGPDERAVPVNEPFELDVLLFEGADARTPLVGAEVLVSAWMPDHGHGMNRRPEAVEVAPGRYLVRGMLLHMGGYWQLFIDVIQGGTSERAQFELELE